MEGWKNEQDVVTAAQKSIWGTEREAELQESNWISGVEFEILVAQKEIFNI